ncbi:MAG: molybdenum ABC transporter ATP-binding protein [Alphaproteobacteria bacterium]|nr:molybdenum ABC transporter ATP-binding protein [Alphaproteobacteria bacterium]
MIEIDIRVRAGGFALDAAFTLPPGFISVFGPSGAGKTTLLRAVAGLETPDEGRIAIDGAPVFDSAAGIALPPETRRFGYVFQDARLFPHLSVRGNLLYGYRRAANHAVRLDDIVDTLAIAPLLDRSPRALSGGERQRVALGRALLMQPRLLLMDEPLAGVDAARKIEIIALIRTVRRFVPAIVHVSHDLDEVSALADHIVLIEAGRTVRAAPADALLRDPDFAIAQREDARAILDGTIAAHGDAITTVALGRGTLAIPRAPLPRGAAVRLQVFARDVSLALVPPQSISVRNITPARIVAIRERSDAQVLIALETDAGALMALVTRDAVRDLNLAPGREVFALVKAVAVR